MLMTSASNLGMCYHWILCSCRGCCKPGSAILEYFEGSPFVIVWEKNFIPVGAVLALDEAQRHLGCVKAIETAKRDIAVRLQVAENCKGKQ